MHKSRYVAGSTRDYRLYKHSHPRLPKEVISKFGLGFVGVEKDYLLLKCVLPFKRKGVGRGEKGVKAEGLVWSKSCLVRF